MIMDIETINIIIEIIMYFFPCPLVNNINARNEIMEPVRNK